VRDEVAAGSAAGDPARLRCARCGDTGFVAQAVAGHPCVRRCDCRRGLPRPQKGDPLERAGIPPAHRRCTLGNFVPRTQALGAAYERALAYCQAFPRVAREGLGLLFWGAKGTGKTHLAVAVLAELAANEGVQGRFWDFTLLVNEIARSFDTRSSASATSTLEHALAADLLVLDDLGSRRMSDWAADTLFAIVNARYMARRPTLVTTAHEDVDREVALEPTPGKREEFLIERVGPRLRSRLLEMCVFVPMQAPSAREGRWTSGRPSTLGGLRRSAKDR